MLKPLICFITLILTCTALIFTCPALSAAPTTQKTVLITGGMSGIGREIALAFKNEDWSVWVTSRDPSQYPTMQGVNVRQLNVTDQAAIKNLIKEIQTKNGHLDVLVNNAGYGILGPTETISAQQARELMDVNVIGPFLLMQEALPVMRANHGGHIINISSTSGLRALPGLGMYAASKMALEGLSEALAAETAQWNIQVSIIEPGTIKNDWITNAIVAEKINDYPGYKTFNHNLQSSLTKKVVDNGQEPQEVALLVVKVANTSKPDLRYQTNSTVAALAHEVLVDPTGNKMRDKTIEFSQQLYQNEL